MLIQQGWKSYITYARYCLPSKSRIIKIGNKFDIYWHGLNTRLFDIHCLNSTGVTKRLVRKIENIKPDVIQIHNIHGYYLNMKVLFDYLSQSKIPVVWTLHDCWAFTGHCVYFDYAGCDKWIDGCYQCPQKKEYPASLILDRSKKNYMLKKKLFTSVNNMVIVPVSYWLGDMVKQSFLNRHKIQVIQNGVDIDVFSPGKNSDKVRKKYNLGNKFIILGVASEWEKRKGLADFIQLNSIIEHDKYKILLVGLSKRQIKYLPDEILGIERTENTEELGELYNLADVFCNPTWEDTFPTTNLESLACGTPVITYQTGGSVESVSKDTGFIVKKGDIGELYDLIKKIRRQGKQYYSYNCRQRAVKNYNKHVKFKEYISLFEELIKNFPNHQ
jgi:glycosyltransferase involved in cell wall biosynthesis